MGNEITRVNNIKKAEWLKVYRNPQLMGNITTVCETIGIGRTIYYKWVEEDEDFRALVAEAKMEMCDLAEETLYARGLEKDTTALIYWLKNRHPDFKESNTTNIQINNYAKATEKASRFVSEVPNAEN